MIRNAAPQDTESILNIYCYYIKETAITYEITVPTVEDFRNRIINTLKKYPYIVEENDGKIIGYAYASAFKNREAYDHSVEISIYVHKDFKRKGIGKKLLQELEARLIKQNILNSYACIAKPVQEDEYLNFDSINFHKKMGYKNAGEFNLCAKKFGRWYSMVWMEKFLGPHN